MGATKTLFGAFGVKYMYYLCFSLPNCEASSFAKGESTDCFSFPYCEASFAKGESTKFHFMF
jgi:hypothetical protein